MDGPPRSYKARPPVKPRTTATLVTDHEREAALARAPYLQLRCCRTNAAEVQCHLTLKQAKTAPGFQAGAANLKAGFLPARGLGASAGSDELTVRGLGGSSGVQHFPVAGLTNRRRHSHGDPLGLADCESGAAALQ